MQTIETYYYGQGRLYSRPKGTQGAGGWRWWGDVSALQFGGTDESAAHKESYSGNKASVRKFSIGGDRTLQGTLHQVDVYALAELLRGNITETAAGTVSAEALPANLAVGDTIKLDMPYNVTDLVITDSTAAPVTLAPENYELFASHGSIDILSIPAGVTQPFKAAYKHAGMRQVAFFAAAPRELELRYEGVNLAEGNAPVIAEFYKVSTQPLQELALITSGNALAGIPFNAEALLDTSKPASGALGQFGRFVQINAVAP
jgi:hypothetical protein